MNDFSVILEERLKKKTAVIGVVGLGYVGLPLSVVVAASGFKVIGFDIQESRVLSVNRCESYIGDVSGEDLRAAVGSGRLEATADYSKIALCDVICIAVPTPLDRFQQPDVRYVVSSSMDIASHVKKGAMIILESTTYPGTTEEVVAPIFKERGFSPGDDIFIAFSPERVDPGNTDYNTGNTPKVVGGLTKDCGELSGLFYRSVLKARVFIVSSPKVAEMEKILENTFRNINIGLMNEMSILCHRMGIDIWEVIEAASTKPYGFMPFYPGPGIGGHCIPIDPFYLTWKAREFDYHTRLIEISSEINNYMPEFVVERAMSILNKYQKPMKGSKILILGMAYKKGISDMRESPALKVIAGLLKKGAVISYNDPYVKDVVLGDQKYESVDANAENLMRSDLVIIITDHAQYDPLFITEHAPAVFDTRNITKGLFRENLERL